MKLILIIIVYKLIGKKIGDNHIDNMINWITVLFITLMIALLVMLMNKLAKPVVSEGFIDPYSLILHADTMAKADWWDVTHRKAFFNNRLSVPYSQRE